jgi:pimeloyl-ACP methyl ester carboxylesterase
MNKRGHIVTIAFVLALLLSLNCYGQQPELATVTSIQNRCNSPCSRPAIVFVHGLAGSAGSWRAAPDKPSWPELMKADLQLAAFDVYELDYITHAQSAPVPPTAQAIVDSVRRVLPPRLENYNTIYLICHSLGGNLMRHYLALQYLGADDSAKKYRGMFLLGTPTEGTSAARFGQLLMIGVGTGTGPVVRTLTVLQDNDYLQLLDASWSQLTARLQKAGMPFKVWAGYEKRPVYGVTVVDESSAVAAVRKMSGKGSPDDRIRGFEQKDHISLIKPESVDDPVYKWVKSKLLGTP